MAISSTFPLFLGDAYFGRSEAGPVDILVNNAGIQHVSPIQDFPEDRWAAVLAINLTAPFLAIKTFIQTMYERRWGRIVNIASAHGLVASPNKVAYCSAKSASTPACLRLSFQSIDY